MRPAILLLATFLSTAPLRAQICAGPQNLGPGEARGISADGSVVVGTTSVGATRWDGAGVQVLGALPGDTQSSAVAVSADGNVVVGSSGPSVELRAFRWTSVGGMQHLGFLPGGDTAEASAVNADGSVVVGTADGGRAFRWTAAGGMQDLGTLGGTFSAAYGVNADGSVVVGSSSIASGETHAFRWTQSGGMQDIGNFGGLSAVARGVSADGSVVVGTFVLGFSPARSFVWTVSGGAQDLGFLGLLDSGAAGVSADGKVVVGSFSSSTSLPQAYSWTETGGFKILSMDLADPSFAHGANADGSTVVGGSFGRAFRIQSSVLGRTYCLPTNVNSAGCGGIVLATGDPRIATGALELTATLLPKNSFGLFLTSRTQGSVGIPGGSLGTLCLGGDIGRFAGPGQVMNSGPSGSISLTVDLTALPAPTLSGVVAAQAGETWNFQCWHRDMNPMPTSNYTAAVSISFE